MIHQYENIYTLIYLFVFYGFYAVHEQFFFIIIIIIFFFTIIPYWLKIH